VAETAKAHVQNWLKASGAKLELAVVETLRKHLKTDQAVVHARYYRDVTLGDHMGSVREVDAVATMPVQPTKYSPTLRITLVIECKATETPWVLYTSRDVTGLAEGHFMAALHVRGKDVPGQISRLKLRPDRLLTPVDQIAYQIADANNQSRDGKDRNTAWNAVRQVLDATASIGETVHQLYIPDTDLLVYVPIIVTTAPLFRVFPASEPGEVNVEETWGAPVLAHWRPRIERRSPQKIGSLSAMWVVSADNWDDFVRRAIATATERF
jgi:hypothetical protein